MYQVPCQGHSRSLHGFAGVLAQVSHSTVKAAKPQHLRALKFFPKTVGDVVWIPVGVFKEIGVAE